MSIPPACLQGAQQPLLATLPTKGCSISNSPLCCLLIAFASQKELPNERCCVGIGEKLGRGQRLREEEVGHLANRN